MLSELEIRNFAIIDALKITFSPGLNILTGETGAGKSIIVGAIGLLLGDRAAAEMIRTGEETAQVTAVFEWDNKGPVDHLLAQWGIDGGTELVVRRTISRSGRSRAYINGNAATLAMLTTLCETLLSICGQHEHQVLLKEENHLDILDTFGGLLTLREQYTRIYDELMDLRRQRDELIARGKQRAERQEFLRYQIALIDEVNPQPGEDASLAEERGVLVNARQLADRSQEAYELIYGNEASVIGGLRAAVTAIRDIRKIDPRLDVSVEELEDMYYRLEAVAFALR
ncbi:MAG: AAA family ATPase, partial [Syntrophales bacterium]|nr:AAA family ATPase [Syntrophales bacterium]